MIANLMPIVTGFLLSCGISLAAQSAVAETLLTVTHNETAIIYDLADLEALDAVTIETETIWTEGTQSFTGVALAQLVADLDLTEGVLLASAINDYTVEIPVTDAVEGGPIIAYLNNGAPMSVRDKGHLWIVYPYDSDPKYQSETIYSRSIWQLNRIETRN